jgi:hypothetical protein
MTMTSNVVRFPYDACRRVHSKKPRRSKNGTPEERAAKAAALETTPADVVLMSDVRERAHSEIDRRKLRGSPLRDYIATVSFGATVVGKMHTAGLRGNRLRRSNLRSERSGWKLWASRLKQLKPWAWGSLRRGTP